ncbi:hypothetical protein [Streptomyces alboflavus]|uniref:hypothetical protein n=1 Tax=Streptomyces alboflavus TaxID=67267 RepID=UPI000F656840|nr:hypothetical protein [Streptomyces alboflavus]
MADDEVVEGWLCVACGYVAGTFSEASLITCRDCSHVMYAEIEPDECEECSGTDLLADDGACPGCEGGLQTSCEAVADEATGELVPLEG